MGRRPLSLLLTLSTAIALTTVQKFAFSAQLRKADFTRAVTLASSAGAALDTDLLKGGGTDDTVALQAVLNRAAHGKPVHLIIDGAALVSGLNVYGNTTLECLAGGGLYLKDQASRDVIRNANRSRGPIRDERITIRGCFINGNRFRQLHSPPEFKDGHNQEADGTLVAGIQFQGVRDVTLEHLTLWSIRTFGILIGNAENIRVRDVRVDNGGPRHDPSLSVAAQLRVDRNYENTDGVHMIGPIRNAILDGLTLHTGDDAIGLTANEGGVDDLTVRNELGPYVGQGPITDVIVSNIILDEVKYGIRLYSSDQRMDRIVIQNVTGSLKNRLLLMSPFLGKGRTGNFGSVSLSSVNVRVIPVLSQRQLYASLGFTEEAFEWLEQENYPIVSLNSPIESLVLQNVTIEIDADRPLIQVGPKAQIGNLSADLTLRDPQRLSLPLRLEPNSLLERMSWKLDWQGQIRDVGKRAIMNRGGQLRQLRWIDTPPMFVASEVDKKDARVVEVTFSQAVQSPDFRQGVTVKVNGSPVHIVDATAEKGGEAVRYRLAAAVRNAVVTWAYDSAQGSIQNLDGDRMRSVLPKKVVIR